MTTPHVAASFAVDVEPFATVGVIDPYGDDSLALYASGRLTSEQRLLLALWGSTQLSSASFDARQRLATQGEAIAAAYVVISGQALGVAGEQVYRLGPGSVIGLAEAFAGLPYSMTVVAVTPLQARLLPAGQILALLPRLPTGLKAILRSAVVRTLALDAAPETLR